MLLVQADSVEAKRTIVFTDFFLLLFVYFFFLSTDFLFFSAYFGQLSVAEAWTNPGPWSIAFRFHYVVLLISNDCYVL